MEGRRPQNTYFSRIPTVRIDHIFVSGKVAVHGIEVPRSALALVASDHLPLVADLDLSAYAEVSADSDEPALAAGDKA
jgi:endonuclease/exonuclease/phosphatase family metal-dependent hydrolase